VSERQLSIAQDRLGVLQGTQVIDNLAASEAAQTDVALERALTEVENLRGRLVEAERHTEQFRLIGASTEAMLKELRERSLGSKEAQEVELRRLKTESDGYKAELESHRATTMASERDIEKAREDLLSEKRENVERIRTLEEETLLGVYIYR
jgi:Asp-tRNA(Asn)/Glu-tRNA(Gln) amidotransferase B subunit